jgi:hypothetical protein
LLFIFFIKRHRFSHACTFGSFKLYHPFVPFDQKFAFATSVILPCMLHVTQISASL